MIEASERCAFYPFFNMLEADFGSSRRLRVRPFCDEPADNFAGEASRPPGCRIKAAPATGNFAQNVISALQHRSEKGSGTFNLFRNDLGNDVVLKKSWPEIGNFMLERDPQVFCDRARRSNAAPIVDHRFLDPFQVHGIVHMTHMVDVGRLDRDGVTEHCS